MMKSSSILIFSTILLIDVAFVNTMVYDLDFLDDEGPKQTCDGIEFPEVDRTNCLNGLKTTYKSGKKYRFGKAWWPLLAKEVRNPRLAAIHYYEAKAKSAEDAACEFAIGLSTDNGLFYVEKIAKMNSKGVANASETNRNFRLKMDANTVLGIGLVVSPPGAREQPQAFFTVNGKLVDFGQQNGHHIPVSFDDYEYFKAKKIYPYLYTAKANTNIELNFGNTDFIYNVKEHPLPPIKRNSEVSIDVTAMGTDSKGKQHKLDTLKEAHIVHAGIKICEDMKIKVKNYWIRGKTSNIYNIDRNKCQLPAGRPATTLLRLVYKLPSKLFTTKGTKGDQLQTIEVKIDEAGLLNKGYYPGYALSIQLDCKNVSTDGRCREDANNLKLRPSSEYKMRLWVETDDLVKGNRKIYTVKQSKSEKSR